ncbi:MAG: hypothetical protein AB7F35_13960 [Acetobacteraceae bacterium]
MTQQSKKADRPAGKVEQKIRSAQDSLPGQRDSLPKGTIGGMPADPQGDENRDPPSNAPAIPDVTHGRRRTTKL